MRKRSPRILVLPEDGETAEAIRRGLSGAAGLDLEIEIALDPDSVRRQTADCRYDVLVAGRSHVNGNGTSLLRDLPDGLPVVAVGGAPGEAPPAGFKGFVVPLPLSFNLLAAAVRQALAGDRAPPEERRQRRELG